MESREKQQVGGDKPPPVASFKDCDSPALPPPTVRLEIIPTHRQYTQLCNDLRELRRRGAESNTVAIIDAVHAATSHKIEARTFKRAEGRMRAPRPRNRR